MEMAKYNTYTSNRLLVGINYDKEAKTHTCVIEKYASNWPGQTLCAPAI